MHKHPEYFSLISLVLAAFIGLFVSCSQNTPEIDSTDYSVIFDYSDDTTAPEARLSVFAESGSDVRRYQRIKITSLESGWTWDTQVLNQIDSEEGQWAGCTNLVAPENEKLPVGVYEITYFNADEKECSVTIDVKYNLEIYDVLLPALPDFMRKNRGVEKIAVYDKDHILIFFGDRTAEYRSVRDIWNHFRDASTYQVIWYTSRGRTICIEPERPVSPDADKKENDGQ